MNPTSQVKRHSWDHFHECGDGAHEAQDLMWSSCDLAALIHYMLLTYTDQDPRHCLIKKQASCTLHPRSCTFRSLPGPEAPAHQSPRASALPTSLSLPASSALCSTAVEPKIGASPDNDAVEVEACADPPAFSSHRSAQRPVSHLKQAVQRQFAVASQPRHLGLPSPLPNPALGAAGCCAGAPTCDSAEERRSSQPPPCALRGAEPPPACGSGGLIPTAESTERTTPALGALSPPALGAIAARCVLAGLSSRRSLSASMTCPPPPPRRASAPPPST